MKEKPSKHPTPFSTSLFQFHRFLPSFSRKQDLNTMQGQLPNNPFDRLPNEAIHIILNKVQDAKTLLRCLPLNKRFASIVPQTDTVSLSLVLTDQQNNKNDNNADANSVDIVKSVVSYLITKLLRRDGSGDSFTDSLCHRLQTFRQIKHLRLEIHTDGVDVTDDFLKWKATYGSEFKTCAMLCALSVHLLDTGEPSRQAGTRSSRFYADYELGWRKKWLSLCMTTASERHCLVKRMLARFPALETVTITDTKRQGRFSMAEDEIRDLRESLKREGASTELSSPERVMPKFLLRMWYATELELPVVGCEWKEAMLLVLEPVDGDGETVVAAKNGGDGGFDGDAEEKAMLAEARREILNSSKSFSYTWVL